MSPCGALCVPNCSCKRALALAMAHTCCALALGLLGCGSSGIVVPRGPHRPENEPAPVRVAEAPPSAKLEVVPLRRNPRCHYLDGHYHPVGNNWVWEKGQWVLVRNGCYYAPPTTSYERVEGGTTLVFRAGAWHRRDEKEGRCTPRACPTPTANDL